MQLWKGKYCIMWWSGVCGSASATTEKYINECAARWEACMLSHYCLGEEARCTCSHTVSQTVCKLLSNYLNTSGRQAGSDSGVRPCSAVPPADCACCSFTFLLVQKTLPVLYRGHSRHLAVQERIAVWSVPVGSMSGAWMAAVGVQLRWRRAQPPSDWIY